MRAILIKKNHLVIEEISEPQLRSTEVLIHVEAIGVNRADLLQRKGKHPPPQGESEILGLEVSGKVEKIGSHVHHFAPGDHVMGLLAGGGYAEKVFLDERLVIPLPKNLSFEEGAAIPETFITAYQALFYIGELCPNQWVLIHAGGSGVGTAAIQLANAGGGKVIATTRSQEKLEKCLQLGAQAVINPLKEGFSKKIEEITEGHGVDLILDFVGEPYFEENMEALAKGGAMILLATLGGSKIENLDLRQWMKKWMTISATTLRNRPIEYKAKLIEEFSHFALPKFEMGMLKPQIHCTYPWTEAERAHEELIENRPFGKIVLLPNG